MTGVHIMKRVAGVCISIFLFLSSLDAKTVKVSDFGFDAVDSTAFVNAAISSDADEVIIDRMPGPWICGPLSFKGLAAKTIRFEPTAVISQQDMEDVLTRMAESLADTKKAMNL